MAHIATIQNSVDMGSRYFAKWAVLRKMPQSILKLATGVLTTTHNNMKLNCDPWSCGMPCRNMAVYSLINDESGPVVCLMCGILKRGIIHVHAMSLKCPFISFPSECHIQSYFRTPPIVLQIVFAGELLKPNTVHRNPINTRGNPLICRVDEDMSSVEHNSISLPSTTYTHISIECCGGYRFLLRPCLPWKSHTQSLFVIRYTQWQ